MTAHDPYRLLGDLWIPPTDTPCKANPEPYYSPGMHPVTAKVLCSGCDYRAECLDQALTDEGNKPANERSGVWGGTTPLQREAIARTGAA